MTLEKFNKLKKDTRKNLERKLEVSKQTGKLYPAVTERATEKFQLLDGASTEEILSLMSEVIALGKHTGVNISHQTFETSEGRIGYYSHTNYYVKYDKIVDEITDDLVKKSVHAAIRGIQGWPEWSYIDCKIMQLFKDGKIDWDTVVESHNKECSI